MGLMEISQFASAPPFDFLSVACIGLFAAGLVSAFTGEKGVTRILSLVVMLLGGAALCVSVTANMDENKARGNAFAVAFYEEYGAVPDRVFSSINNDLENSGSASTGVTFKDGTKADVTILLEGDRIEVLGLEAGK